MVCGTLLHPRANVYPEITAEIRDASEDNFTAVGRTPQSTLLIAAGGLAMAVGLRVASARRRETVSKESPHGSDG
jgi:hypothetical protein